MSRFLLLNFEDFSLNQDITKAIQSHRPFCICCLQTDVPLINLVNCKHSSFLDIYFKPELKHHNHVVCQQCHGVLIKIKQFKEQVENSIHKLQNESFNIVEQKAKRRLNIHKTVDVLLSPTNGDETVALNEIKSEPALENEETPSNIETDVNSTKKLKNIQNALEIINNNRADDSLAVLNMGLQCLQASNLRNLISEPLNVKEEPEDCGQSSPQYEVKYEDISIKDENIEFNNIDNEIVSSVNTAALATSSAWNFVCGDDGEGEHALGAPEETTEKPLGKIELREKATQRCLYIKTVTLSKEEVIKERYLKTQSVDYLRLRYKCDHCIVGFSFKDNLEDHMQRKHTPKLDSVTCDLCMQVLHPIGSFHAHNLNHYTTYECVNCKKRFPEYGDALKHYKNQHGFRKVESKCRFCDFTGDSKSKLKVHIQKCHNKFPCEVCGVSLASPASRKLHKMVKHEKKCSHCELHFTSSYERSKHMQRNHAYCTECDVRFKSWHAFMAHMRFSVAHADKKKSENADECREQDQLQKIKRPKSNAQKCKEYRERQKTTKKIELRKKNAQKCKEYRERVKSILKTDAQNCEEYREKQEVRNEIEVRMKNAQKCKVYRERQKSINSKISAEYKKEYRRRMKLKNQSIQLNSLLTKDPSDATAYNSTMEKQPDEPEDFTNEPLPSMSEPMEVQDTVASTLATPFAQPIITASKSKAQKQREYRQRIAASRTPAQAAAARKSKNERQRNNRLRQATNLAIASGSLEATTTSSSCSGEESNNAQTRNQRQHAQQQSTTTADQPDERVNLANEPLFPAIPVPMEVQEAVASTSATPFAEPITAAPKTRAQIQREYRQRIAASKTPAQAAAAREARNVRDRKNRLCQATNLAIASGSLEATTTSSSRSGQRLNTVHIDTQRQFTDQQRQTLATEPAETTVQPSTSSDQIEVQAQSTWNTK